jgi:phosphoglucosamine mutase
VQFKEKTIDMTRKYFGTDGIRGTVGQSPITPDFMLKLAHSVGRVLKKHHDKPLVLIGKDTRISGYMLESALESGFNSAGVDVLLLGPLPTPGVAYLTRAQRANLGVVISASHNPFADNGIKFFSERGSKLPDSWELEVEEMMQEPSEWVSSAQLGKTRRLNDAQGRYLEFCKSTFDPELSLHGLKIVVDAAHGAAYQIAPALLNELGAEVIPIGCAPNGLNINDQVGATHPQAMAHAVSEHGAHFGISLDGDADRLLVADADARLYDGDQLLYLIAKERCERGESIQGVVGTLMTNMAIEIGLKNLGIDLVRAKVGDRYVLESLLEKQWILGGEGSGHLLVLDQHSTGDGLISALQVLQACQRAKKSLGQWLSEVELYPQVLINVKVKGPWRASEFILNAQRQAEKALEGEGRVLIRPSGTEPLVRVMVEAKDAQKAQHWAEHLAREIEQE